MNLGQLYLSTNLGIIMYKLNGKTEIGGKGKRLDLDKFQITSTSEKIED